MSHPEKQAHADDCEGSHLQVVVDIKPESELQATGGHGEQQQKQCCCLTSSKELCLHSHKNPI